MFVYLTSCSGSGMSGELSSHVCYFRQCATFRVQNSLINKLFLILVFVCLSWFASCSKLHRTHSFPHVGHSPSFSSAFYLETYARHDPKSLFCNDELSLQVLQAYDNRYKRYSVFNTLVPPEGTSFLLPTRPLISPILVSTSPNNTIVWTQP